MERVIRNVAELDHADRRALEHVLGQSLTEHQQIIINVVSLEAGPPVEPEIRAPELVPAWWNVYGGLSEEEVDRLDRSVRARANLTRGIG